MRVRLPRSMRSRGDVEPMGLGDAGTNGQGVPAESFTQAGMRDGGLSPTPASLRVWNGVRSVARKIHHKRIRS